VALTLSDGDEADQLNLTLEDSDMLKHFEVPDKDDVLTLALGYGTTLTDMGSFVVQGVSLSGGAGDVDTYTLNATSINALGNLYDKKSVVWQAEEQGQETDLKTIISAIASENGLTAKISPSLQSIKTAREVQYRESDISFLRRLAGKNTAWVKFRNNDLLFIVNQPNAVSGAPLVPVPLAPQDIINWQYEFGFRFQFNTVHADWWDKDNAKYQRHSENNDSVSNNKEDILTTTFRSKIEATEAAKARLLVLNKKGSELTLSLLGNAALMALSQVVVGGLRQPLNGQWQVQQVTHNLDSSGFTSNLRCRALE
jgi:phage protein D